MSTEERTVYRYGDFPELFWDLQRDVEVDAENPAIIARLLEHAPPATIGKLIPAPVLLRDFEKLHLPEHTRRFWSLVIGMMREQRGLRTPRLAREERGITFRARPRFHPGSDRPQPVEPRGTYTYGDLPDLFWDQPHDQVVDGTNPVIMARLLENASPDIIWKLVPVDALLREFEQLDLQDHTRRFWRLVVENLRENRLQTRSPTTA
jgi:hypothetical protein